jgi:hypothetical protein
LTPTASALRGKQNNSSIGNLYNDGQKYSKFITKNSGVHELAKYSRWKSLTENGNKRREGGSNIQLISSTFCTQQHFAIKQSGTRTCRVTCRSAG